MLAPADIGHQRVLLCPLQCDNATVSGGTEILPLGKLVSVGMSAPVSMCQQHVRGCMRLCDMRRTASPTQTLQTAQTQQSHRHGEPISPACVTLCLAALGLCSCVV